MAERGMKQAGGASWALDRRSFLRYVGWGAGALGGAEVLGPLLRPAHAADAASAPASAPGRPWVLPDGTPDWVGVPYPVPIPGDGGTAATDPQRLAEYVVRDDLLLPAGFSYRVVAQWGERFGPPGDPKRQVRFGMAADYTALVPLPGRPDEYYLVVNHEYISARPWLQGYARAHGADLPPLRLLVDPDDSRYPDGRLEVDGVLLEGPAFDPHTAAATLDAPTLARVRTAVERLCAAAMGDLGVTALHVRRGADGGFSVVADSPLHRRISGLTRPVATFDNCSGGTTPWGTVLTCEENFQDQVAEFITPAGARLESFRQPFRGAAAAPHTGLPFEFRGLATGLPTPHDGRQFGWVAEVDPAGGTLRKLHRLGRFRHENVALRAEPGRPLVCYMGDDRRGGHVWKFVSAGRVSDPADPASSRLLDDGTLYVARFNADFTGQWIPLVPGTALVRPQPEHLAGGHVWLPRRPQGGHVAVGTPQARKREASVAEWVASVEAFAGGRGFEQLTLGDLVTPPAGADAAATAVARQDILLMDAYAMANAVGGTPCARPEDVEIHPLDGSVYLAFTDSTGSGDGSPDARIFPDSAGAHSRQYGAIYRLLEDGAGRGGDPAATTFTWGKFISSGEVADNGGGFACADNLVFDPQGNLWMCCDITTPAHNFPINRTDGTTAPGQTAFMGVFGNNALFMIPTAGPKAGVPHCFAIGPMEAEMTGPTFTADGRTLLLSVQHPGELNGTRGWTGVGGRPGPAEEVRELVIAGRDGTTFRQRRTVPLGSNFPSGKLGEPPRACVVCITRTA